MTDIAHSLPVEVPRVEMHGTDVIGEADRHGKPSDLFWPWCAATISILGVSYGAFTLSYGLSFGQAIIAIIVGVVISCALCGIIAIAGKRGSAPTLVVSRAAFGVEGNRLPALICWLLSLGWEIVAVVLGALATATVFRTLGWGGGNGTLAVALVVVIVLIVGGGVLGYDTVMRMQTWITYVTGVLTVVFFILTIHRVHLGSLSSLHSGPTSAVIGATIFLMVGGGLGWVNAAADYSRYLPRSASSAGVATWTALGLGAVPILLIVYGALLTASDAKLGKAIAADPIGALASILPTWFLLPFAIVAILGQVGIAVLEIYSSGLALLSVGAPVTRPVAAGIDGVLMTIASIYVLFIASGDFFTQFQGFIITLGVPVSAWAGIMLADIALRKREYDEDAFYDGSGRYGAFRLPTLAILIVASVVGFGFVTNTSAGWLNWQGYFMALVGGKSGTWGAASLGVIAALLIGFVGYALLQNHAVAAQEEREAVLR
jgi:NCS1 family nucleobase:cation symporter-1